MIRVTNHLFQLKLKKNGKEEPGGKEDDILVIVS